jgi:UDP-N-acetylglucosamine 4,6-dehydratase/5-epimerase
MKILITGGNGTLGQAIMQNYPEYSYAIICRNELHLKETVREFGCSAFLGDINDYDFLVDSFKLFSPDVVIHAAAIKHFDVAEKYPLVTIQTNVIGTINVINAVKQTQIPILIGISTDKACDPKNIYGNSKLMLEKLFASIKSNNKFLVVRFANIANSSGSAIQIWSEQKRNNKPITVTDPNMMRLMFSKADAAAFVMNVLLSEKEYLSGSTICKLTSVVNIQELATLISSDIKVIGAVLGEKLNENLISLNELPYTKVLLNNMVLIAPNENPNISTRLQKPYNTQTATRMSIEQMKSLLKE